MHQTYLKAVKSWEDVGRLHIYLKKDYFGMNITTMFECCIDKLHRILVKNTKNGSTIENLRIENMKFENLKSAKYACDVRFNRV